MTRAQCFAREWLWWVCCAMVSVAVTFIVMMPEFPDDPREGAMASLFVGLAMSLPLYLVTGAVRLTVWALNVNNRTSPLR